MGDKTLTAHSQKKEALLRELGTDPRTGLTEKEARRRLAQYGPNKLAERKKKSGFVRFLEQFKDVMIFILIVAAGISFALACMGDDWLEFLEPVLILAIVILNAIMGFVQENKAEKALDALRQMSAPHARVLREGKETILPAVELVPGDIVFLEAGDYVPADARILRSANLRSEESALTGESVPSEKDAEALAEEKTPVGDRSNMVFAGCMVTYGTATVVATGTGMNTEMGKIATLLSNESDVQTPLQKKLARLGRALGFVALAACAVVFLIGLIAKQDVMEMFMTAVSLAVSAIPEGLPAIVTIVLSIGVTRMVKKNAIIRRLPAVETLGSASVICSDKTGTLTQNRMTLVRAYAEEEGTDEEISDHNSEAVRRLLRYAALCCNAAAEEDGEDLRLIGDPTETAILRGAYRNGLIQAELEREFPRCGELPFDSDRKRMSTVHREGDGYFLIVKGAFDGIIPLCNGSDFGQARQKNEQMSAEALRVLAVAYKKLSALPETLNPQELEEGLTFLGLVGMIDPPRPEAKEAVAVCRRAGIKPVMITGDHVATASAVARELDILQEGDLAITGAQLDAMTDAELEENLETISVCARVSPENKIRIVKAWQKKGQVVAMTGDGVNDALALKAADIGCAMGITGTEVAKSAADMTLTDDNFATIVGAVREGRGIYANIKKVVGFLLGTNISEILIVFLAMIFWQRSPFISIQLLWINLITDSLPALALGTERVEDDIMNKKPMAKNESLFAHGYGLRIFLQGCLFAALSLGAYFIGEQMTGTVSGGSTLAFVTLALSQVFHAYNMRSDHSLFQIGPFSNKRLNWVTLLSVFLVALVTLVPGVVTVFGMTYIPWYGYLAALGLSLVPLVVMEIAKAVGLVRHHSGRG